jgi:hypothetical protein
MNRTTLHPQPTACILIVLFAVLCGCAPKESGPALEAQPPLVETQPPQISVPTATNEPPEAILPEGSGETAWAENFNGQLIAGLDGELYEPYQPVTIERTQRTLMERGLYTGPVNGILDAPTMKAIYTFQELNHNLQVCGVPTPRTRKILEQGSHTDPAL